MSFVASFLEHSVVSCFGYFHALAIFKGLPSETFQVSTLVHLI